MLANFMAAVRKTVVNWARACGHAVKRLVEPGRSAAIATSGVARDSARSRTVRIPANPDTHSDRIRTVIPGNPDTIGAKRRWV